MEFSFENQSNSSDQNVASERLRKAIERNRAKQAKRATTSSRGAKRQWTPPGQKSSSSTSSTFRSRASSVRTGVARPDEETEFSSDPKKRRRASTSQTKASYLPQVTKTRKRKSSAKRTGKKTDKDFARYLVIGSWLFCGFLLLRLIFSAGGVVDYYSSKSLLESRIIEKERLVQENLDLREEIRLIESSSSYQRQLIRDHLGYIARDEHLVIFSNGFSDPSI